MVKKCEHLHHKNPAMDRQTGGRVGEQGYRRPLKNRRPSQRSQALRLFVENIVILLSIYCYCLFTIVILLPRNE